MYQYTVALSVPTCGGTSVHPATMASRVISRPSNNRLPMARPSGRGNPCCLVTVVSPSSRSAADGGGVLRREKNDGGDERPRANLSYGYGHYGSPSSTQSEDSRALIG